MARYGFAKDIITPPFKTNLACSGLPGVLFDTIHDDVYVKAAVLDDGAVKALIVSFDLLFHDSDLFDFVREYASKYGVAPENVVAAATHDHNSPPSTGYAEEYASQEYEAFLLDRTSACIDRAFSCMFEGTLEYGIAHGEWNVNRRIPKNGKMGFGPNPDGVIDDRMDLIAVRDVSGRLRGLITGYGCHPVHYPDRTTISSEYPGRFCSLLEAEYYGCTAMFMQTAGGNSRPKLSNKKGGFQQCTFEELDQMSSSMAKAVGDLLRSCSMRKMEISIAGRMFDVTLHFDRMPFENFKIVADNPSKPSIYIRNAKYTCAHYDDMPETMALHCGVIRLADGFAIAHMGGEPCFEVKFLVEEALAGCDVFFIGFTDDCDYIATDKLLAEGGYEADGCYIEYCKIGPISQGMDAAVKAAFMENAAGIGLLK